MLVESTRSELVESMLNEASILDEPRRIVEVTIIKPGPAKARLDEKPVSYTDDALRESLPLWEGAACFCDHWDKSVRNIAGVFFAPWYDDGVKAKLRFLDEGLYHLVSQIIADRESELPVPDIGISADIGVTAVPRDDVLEVEQITNVISADIVFSPAAGGSFDRVLNAVREAHPEITVLQNQVSEGDSPGRDDPDQSQTRPGEELVPVKRVRDLQSAADKLRAQVRNQEENIAQLEADLSEAVSRHREAILEKHPEIPRDLVSGATIAEIDSSLENALALVDKVKEHIKDQDSEEPVPPGSPPRGEVDVSGMSPREKIQYGLKKEGK